MKQQLCEGTQLSEEDSSAQAQHDLEIIEWIERPLPEPNTLNRLINFFVQASPVFGTFYAQVAHCSVLLGLVVFQCFHLFSVGEKIQVWLEENGFEPRMGYGIILSPLAIAMAFIKLVQARMNLKSNSILQMYSILSDDQHDVSSFAAVQGLTSAAQCVDLGAELEEIKTSHRVQIMCTMLLPIFLTCILYGALYYMEHNLSGIFFWYVAFPWVWSLPVSLISNTTIGLAASLAVCRIRSLRCMIESWKRCIMNRGEKKPDGFLRDFVGTYFQFDRMIADMCGDSINLIVTSTAGVGAMTFYFLLVAFATVDTSKTVCIICTLCAAFALWSLLSVLLPLARATDLCHDVQVSSGGEPSLLLAVLQLGGLDMTAEEALQFQNLVMIMTTCPSGARFPAVGLLTTSDIMSAAKIICAAVPTIITYSLTYVHHY